MLRRLLVFLASLIVVALLLTACGRSATVVPTGAVSVTVSIVPQEYFVQRIGGEHVQVNVMVGRGDEPHTYEPKPEQLRSLSTAQVYLRAGVDFEDVWMDRITASNPDMLIVDTTAGIERTSMAAPDIHGEEERHDADEPADASDDDEAEHPDPHVWLSPRLAKVQARNIGEALIQIDPGHQEQYAANLAYFLADIDTLDAVIRDTLQGLSQRSFIVFHPSWGYFARDYGLEMIPVEIGGQEPSAAELAAIISYAQEEEIEVIFAQPELSTRSAETIAGEIGGQVVLVSPLAPDWLDNLYRVADAFAQALDG